MFLFEVWFRPTSKGYNKIRNEIHKGKMKQQNLCQFACPLNKKELDKGSI